MAIDQFLAVKKKMFMIKLIIANII